MSWGRHGTPGQAASSQQRSPACQPQASTCSMGMSSKLKSDDEHLPMSANFHFLGPKFVNQEQSMTPTHQAKVLCATTVTAHWPQMQIPSQTLQKSPTNEASSSDMPVMWKLQKEVFRIHQVKAGCCPLGHSSLKAYRWLWLGSCQGNCPSIGSGS